MKKAVVIVSGGLDSSALLWDTVRGSFGQWDEIRVLSVNYGQRHKRELRCAKWQADFLGLQHIKLDMITVGQQILQGSALTSDIEVPDGHYEADNAKITVVPNRNMLLLSLATSYLVSFVADGDEGGIFYGAHAGDFAVYADCRPEFVAALAKAIALCDFKKVELFAPYAEIFKWDIAKKAIEMGMDKVQDTSDPKSIPLQHTHTCYKGHVPACAKCPTCCERLLSFDRIGAVDPLPYKGGWNRALAGAKQMEAEYNAKKAGAAQ